jgi:uncharacterized protein YdiU (UPF0061 family)
MARTHLRFGTCERLLHRRRPDLLERLLRHVVAVYYPSIAAAHPVDCRPGAAADAAANNTEPQLLAFYGELVERMARLAAEWMAAGFTHGVLNTDNMSLAGESFDYGPFAFLDRWDPGFTAAYFDHSGLYAYGQQPLICHHNLRLLQEPLAMLLPRAELEARLERFAPTYDAHDRHGLLRLLGLATARAELPDPVLSTLQLLAAWPVGYGSFFAALAAHVGTHGLPAGPEDLIPFVPEAAEPPRSEWLAWREAWWSWSHGADSAGSDAASAGEAGMGDGDTVAARLQRWNLPVTPIRPVIEQIWEAIDQHGDQSTRRLAAVPLLAGRHAVVSRLISAASCW